MSGLVSTVLVELVGLLVEVVVGWVVLEVESPVVVLDDDGVVVLELVESVVAGALVLDEVGSVVSVVITVDGVVAVHSSGIVVGAEGPGPVLTVVGLSGTVEVVTASTVGVGVGVVGDRRLVGGVELGRVGDDEDTDPDPAWTVVTLVSIAATSTSPSLSMVTMAVGTVWLAAG